MANRRHVIRKLEVDRYTPVDDQLWPLTVAMFLLGGFLAGTASAYLRFDDVRWYANAWTWLMAIPLIIAVTLTWLAFTGNRVLRRTMQLAIVLCAIIHIGLFVVAVETNVFRRVWMQVLARTDQPLPKKVVRVPEYFAWQHDPKRRKQRDFEQPVETPLPDPKPQVDPHQTSPREPVVVEQQPRPVPEPQQTVRPEIVKRRQVDASIPRFREQPSKFSRRTADASTTANSSQAVPVPSIPQTRPRSPAPLEARNEQVTPSEAPSRLAQTAPVPTPTGVTATPLQPKPVAKAEPTMPLPLPSATAKLQRRSVPQPVLPRTDVQSAPQSAVAKQTEPTAPIPNNTAVVKHDSRSPETQPRVNQPARELPARVASRPIQRTQAAEPRPTLARTPRSLPNRRSRLTTRPELSAAAESAVSVPSPPDAPADPRPAALAAQRTQQPKQPAAAKLAGTETTETPSHQPASATQLARRPIPDLQQPETKTISSMPPARGTTESLPFGSMAQRVSPPARVPTTAQQEMPSPSSLAMTRTRNAQQLAGNATAVNRVVASDSLGDSSSIQSAPPRRASAEFINRPSLNLQAAGTEPPRRAASPAATPASPTPVEAPVSPRTIQSRQPTNPTPQSLALNKANLGIAAGGAGRNAGQSANLAAGQATIASASAKRAEAVQNMSPGPALAPSAPTLARSGRADQSRPRTTRAALPTIATIAAGSRQPAEMTASASAALTQAASNAQRGATTAAKGTTEVDIGPTMQIAGSGTTRADGGGQPELHGGNQHLPAHRALIGPRATPSLSSRVAAATPAAPATTGGGQLAGLQEVSQPRREIAGPADLSGVTIGGPASAPSGPQAAASMARANVLRQNTGTANGPESNLVSQQDARLARKAVRTRQTPVESSVADVNLGNATDPTTSEQPAAASIAAATVATTKQPNIEGTARNPGFSDNAEDTRSGQTATTQFARARAEAVDGAPGEPEIGGGNASVTRIAVGPAVVTNTRADVTDLAGGPQSSGQPVAVPQSSQGNLPARFAAGTPDPRTSAPVGADPAGDASDDPAIADPIALRSTGRAAVPSEKPLAIESNLVGVRRRNTTSVAPTTDTEVAQIAGLASAASAANMMPDTPPKIAGRADPGSLRKAGGTATPVRVEALEDIGGIGTDVTVDVGIARRHARQQSADVQLDAVRFARRDVGGIPDFNTVAAVAAEPFRQRVERGKSAGQGDVAEGPGPETEQAIELGLVFLSRWQSPDGSWKLDRFAQQDGLPAMASDSAATGLAVLAFQGAGYHHRDYRYADTVRRGIEFLVRNQQPDGELFVPMDDESNRVVRFYSHGIATLALCEAYGMTQDPWLKPVAQKAIDYIVTTQNAERGGWRYTAGVSSDTSVTGWMLMALKSGELANLNVPTDTYDRMRKWLDRAQVSASVPYLYCYNPYAPDTPTQRQGRLPTKTMTSVGLLMRLYLGWTPNDPNMIRGAEFLLESPPAIGTSTNPQRDTYYWYYATQVLFHMGGSYWTTWWNQHLHPLLVDSQTRDGQFAGSWEPLTPVPDRWAQHAGRLYVTTMNLLSLEVYYRHLPLYKKTRR